MKELKLKYEEKILEKPSEVSKETKSGRNVPVVVEKIPVVVEKIVVVEKVIMKESSLGKTKADDRDNLLREYESKIGMLTSEIERLNSMLAYFRDENESLKSKVSTMEEIQNRLKIAFEEKNYLILTFSPLSFDLFMSKLDETSKFVKSIKSNKLPNKTFSLCSSKK